jgi:hypothetical protein
VAGVVARVLAEKSSCRLTAIAWAAPSCLNHSGHCQGPLRLMKIRTLRYVPSERGAASRSSEVDKSRVSDLRSTAALDSSVWP